MNNDTTKSPNPMKKKKSVLVTISKKEFDSIPQKRAGYILACGIVQLLFVGDRVYEYLVGPVHDYAVYALVAGFFIAYCAMYIQLIFAMRIMQFHWLLIIPTCVIVFFPIFGVMPLGLMDRRIAENWDSAQEKQDQYRQRIKDEDGDRPSEK